MLPGVASIATYDGAKQDYSAPIDSTTDRSAAGANPERGDVAAMTHTASRCWARLTLLSSGGTPTLVAHDENWNNGNNAAPIAARLSAGVFTLTYPVTVLDEIPATMPGYSGPITLVLRGGWGNSRGAVYGHLQVVPTAANVLQATFYGLSGSTPTIMDPPSNTDVDVYGL